MDSQALYCGYSRCYDMANIMAYILLADWCKKHGIDLQRAKDAARRGSLKKFAKTASVKQKRLVILENTDPKLMAKKRYVGKDKKGKEA